MSIAFEQVAQSVIQRGDLAHLALFLWASGATAAATLLVRELAASNRRFDAFVRELALFNRHMEGSR